MKCFITGGTGFVGNTVTDRLAQLGHEVTVLTRSAKKGRTLPHGASFLEGDPRTPGVWQESLAGHDVVINLAGASIFTIWTKAARRTILESRVLTTRNVVNGLAAAGRSNKDVLLLNASAVGYYGGHEDDWLLDETSPAGDDFLADVARTWEAEAVKAREFGVRVVLCRFGIVLGKHGGALAKMVPAFKYYLGSPLGSGKQWFPWIHLEDLVRIMIFGMERRDVSGPLNCTAPNPVRNEEMTRTLAEALGASVVLPAVPGFLLKLLLGEFGSVLLEGQRAVPTRLLQKGFQFRFPWFRGAVEDLLG